MVSFRAAPAAQAFRQADALGLARGLCGARHGRPIVAAERAGPQPEPDRVVKLALVADIHANLEALQATLDDIALRAPDRIVCLGDIVGYNTRPAECIALLRNIDALCVAGNHDLAVCGRIRTETFSNAATRALGWTQQRLVRDDLDFLGSLPLRATVAGRLIAVHGGLYPETGYATVRLDSDTRRMQTLKALVADPTGARICAFGHTHHAAVHEFRRGRMTSRPEQKIRLQGDAYYLVNPGTVGQPRSGDRRSSYMMLDLAQGTLELHRVGYEISAPLAATRQAGLVPPLTLALQPAWSSMTASLRRLRQQRPLKQLVALLDR
jgi:predicted phosphodiesterase